MKKSEIQVGGVYLAKVNNRVVRVRVDRIENMGGHSYTGGNSRTRYDVTNLTTGRRTTFRSAAKFRSAVSVANGS